MKTKEKDDQRAPETQYELLFIERKTFIPYWIYIRVEKSSK